VRKIIETLYRYPFLRAARLREEEYFRRFSLNQIRQLSLGMKLKTLLIRHLRISEVHESGAVHCEILIR